MIASYVSDGTAKYVPTAAIMPTMSDITAILSAWPASAVWNRSDIAFATAGLV
jgi:hypothetical protein